MSRRRLAAADARTFAQWDVATVEPSPAGWQFRVKKLSGGQLALALVNLTDSPLATRSTWEQLGFATPPHRVRGIAANSGVRSARPCTNSRGGGFSQR